MRYYDLVRTEPTPEMEEVAEKLGVKLLYNIKNISVVGSLSEAKREVARSKAVFTPVVDEALLSLAQQHKSMLGFFVSDVTSKTLRRYVEWVRLTSRSRVPVLLATGARKVHQMRAPRDVARIGILLGMKKEDAFAAVSRRWGVILEAD